MPSQLSRHAALRAMIFGAIVLSSTAGCGDSSASTGPATGQSVARVTVTATSLVSDAVGDTIRFRAEALTAAGTPVTGASVQWSVSAPGVATVATDGLVTTRGNGTVTISAAAGSVTGSATLTVAQKAVTLQASKDSLVLDRWFDSVAVTVIAVDRLGAAVPATLQWSTLQWSSSDTLAARVSAAGVVTSGRAGQATITVSVPGSASVRDTVAVRVAVQRNAACAVPGAAASGGAASAPASWTAIAIDSSAVAMSDTTLIGPIGAPVALDVDGDARLDVVVPWYIVDRPATRQTIAGLQVFRNTGAGLTNVTASVWGNAVANWVYPRVPLVFDADGNGRQDLLLLDTGYDPAGYPGAGCGDGGDCPGARNTLLLSNGGVLSDASSKLGTNTANAFSHSGDAADIDCDGDVDYLEGTWSSSSAPEPGHLQVNAGGGNFQADDSRLPANLSRTAGWVGVAVCDLDRDGDPDAIVSTYGQRPSVLVNDGYGHFRLMPTATIPVAAGGDAATEYAEIRCGDFDGDGWNDIVLGRHGHAVAGTAYTILLNSQGMTFSDATADAPSTLPQENGSSWIWNLTVADVNADQWPDLVLMSTNARARIMYGAGAGRFTEYVFPSSDWWIGGGNKVVVADFDGNGRPDLYVYRGKFDHYLMTNR